MTYHEREALAGQRKAQHVSNMYRNDYLALRKQIREWARDNDIDLPENIRKAIGMRNE